MAFLLYKIDRSAGFYRLVQELNASNGCSLWGNGGAVGRCARGQVSSGEGPWSVTEAVLIADVLPRVAGLQLTTGDKFAILDDLVPGTNSKVPVERTVARLVRLDGLGLFQDYNPFVFAMREVLNAPVPADAEDRDGWVRPGLESIALERDDARIIRSVNYLWRGWQPPRSFSGALLWPEHWEQLKRC